MIPPWPSRAQMEPRIRYREKFLFSARENPLDSIVLPVSQIISLKEYGHVPVLPYLTILSRTSAVKHHKSQAKEIKSSVIKFHLSSRNDRNGLQRPKGTIKASISPNAPRPQKSRSVQECDEYAQKIQACHFSSFWS